MKLKNPNFKKKKQFLGNPLLLLTQTHTKKIIKLITFSRVCDIVNREKYKKKRKNAF